LNLGCATTGFSNFDFVPYFERPVDQALIRAVQQNNTKEILTAINNGADINAVGKDSIRPIYVAAIRNKYESFTTLLDQGAETEFPIDGPALLLVCSAYRESKYLIALLESGSDPNYFEEGDIPILLRGMYTDIPIENFILLLKYGADPDYFMNPAAHLINSACSFYEFHYAKAMIIYGKSIAFEVPEIREYIINEKLLNPRAKMTAEKREFIDFLEEYYDIEID
jgi:hypothetical protein